MRAMVIAVVMALSLRSHVGLTMPSKKVHKMSARVSSKWGRHRPSHKERGQRSW